MKEYQNYLFDLYGTLVDVHTDERKAVLWEKLAVWLAGEGAHYSPEQLQTMYFSRVKQLEAQAKAERGCHAEIDIAAVFSEFYTPRGIEPTKARIENVTKLFRLLSLEKLRLFDGVEELMQRLHGAGKRVYLLSNAQYLFTWPEICALGLDAYFDGVIISSVEGLKKPDVRLYRLALERFGLEADTTVMVGNDDRADCHGAAAAGLDSMYVFTEQSPERTKALPENCRVLSKIGDAFRRNVNYF